LKRRDFVKDALLGATAAWQSPALLNLKRACGLFGFQEGMPLPPNTRIPDMAQYEETQHPLLAGRFDEALRTLLPAVKERPGIVPYTIAVIYLRMERCAEGIPYALQACRDTPDDLRYKWMLRTLTILAGQPESSIPKEFRLKVAPGYPSTFEFRDVTDSAGAGRLGLGRGAAWGDFDNDGRDDILVGAERAPFSLLRNLGNGKFENVAGRMGLIDPLGVGSYTSQFIDYDNDGFQDIFLCGNGWGGTSRVYLFHNERGQRFVDVTQSAGLAVPMDAFSASWADYDKDGNVDLAVATGIIDPEGGDRIRLYHNEGNGKFREVGEAAGLTRKARWISVCWGDYDGDGRPDLLGTSYDNGPFLYHNLGGGRFEDVTDRAGIRAQVHAYTCEFFDYDNDGKLDAFVSAYPEGDYKSMIETKLNGTAVPRAQRQLLFRNNGDGTFRNVTEEAGITGWYGGMSSQIADVDNDGFDEIFLGTGNPALDWCEPKPLFHNQGNGQFREISDAAGLVHYGMLHGMAFSDFDNSGNLSMFGSFGGFFWGSRETSKLYRNLGSGNQALEVRLIGTRSNRDAIGARVLALAGPRRIFKWVDGGTGFGCNNSRVVHLGLGHETRVNQLQIDWPSGLRQTFENIPSGQRIEITEAKNEVRTQVKFIGGLLVP